MSEQADEIFRNRFIELFSYNGIIPDDWQVLSLEDVADLSAGGDKPKIVSDKELYTYLLQNRKWILDNNFLHSERQLLKFIRLKLGDVIHYNPESNIYYL